jgi:hypothetical protein
LQFVLELDTYFVDLQFRGITKLYLR